MESNLRERARSYAGARGLLQVMPDTAASLELDAANETARWRLLHGCR